MKESRKQSQVQTEQYVISNNKGINGAVSMLYEDGLHDLAEKLGSDLYIMPSSIHEVIAVSTDKAVKRITDFLTAHGIDISESVVKDSDVSDIKNMISEAKEEPLKEQEVIPTEKEPTL